MGQILLGNAADYQKRDEVCDEVRDKVRGGGLRPVL